ncbi:hypothetical protein PPMP20_03140 [Paraburkholderia phymatum]|uniref:Uncharacterized protein n=1 Tax=Paraburkholderia phymatum (strain DSM 17167 / CIP 108236 / LMG 21445 / STM815) TaxID=391038 RepID=B2JWV6_PARP8|nr:hypothetical protein [Paraburkholderia phymatum]ACC75433.1 hypothetical protein Bphy_6403 [Paraburkholderia phymatum STM815]
MTADCIDYDALTLTMEKRIAAHVKAARKQRSRLEDKERVFFTAAANEALFVWMQLASRMNSVLYCADKVRLTRMVEEIGTQTSPVAHERFPVETLTLA